MRWSNRFRVARLVGCLAVCAALLWAVSPPVEAAVNNGLFEGGWVAAGTSSPFDLTADFVPTSWNRVETFTGKMLQPGGGLVTVPEWASISVVRDNGPSALGQWALQCTRSENPIGGTQSGDWTAVWQNLNIDASQYAAMSLSIDTKVIAHNLEAGGWSVPAFEWPVTLEITYTPQGGGSQIWRYGWYLDPPGDAVLGPANDPGQGLIGTYNDMVVPANVWMTTAFNLFNELPQVGTITRIRVGGSGWDYEGRADNIIMNLTYIPEPSTILIWSLLAGLGIGVGWRRRGR